MIDEPRFLRPIQAVTNNRDQPALVGYSGGGDSTALLHLLQNAGFSRIIACHLHHGLRGEEADEDADFCQAVAREMNISFEMQKTDVQAWAQQGKLSVETAARQARHCFFAAMSGKYQTNQLWLAHHADDQAETVLFHLLRGAGLQGLGGMAASSRLRVKGMELQVQRPLLPFTHAELLRLNARRGWKFREDTTNAELLHCRNRLRTKPSRLFPGLSPLTW